MSQPWWYAVEIGLTWCHYFTKFPFVFRNLELEDNGYNSIGLVDYTVTITLPTGISTVTDAAVTDAASQRLRNIPNN